jgi:hypothetical protein
MKPFSICLLDAEIVRGSRSALKLCAVEEIIEVERGR